MQLEFPHEFSETKFLGKSLESVLCTETILINFVIVILINFCQFCIVSRDEKKLSEQITKISEILDIGTKIHEKQDLRKNGTL